MKEIVIRGTARPIHFGMRAINEFTKNTQGNFETNITTTEAIATIDSVVAVAAVGLNEGARLSKRTERYTVDDVWDFVDEDPILILKIADIFKESIDALTDKLGDLDPNV